MLPVAEFTHNSWKHDVTKFTPHELLIGTRPLVNIKLLEDQVSQALDHLKELEEARKTAQT